MGFEDVRFVDVIPLFKQLAQIVELAGQHGLSLNNIEEYLGLSAVLKGTTCSVPSCNSKDELVTIIAHEEGHNLCNDHWQDLCRGLLDEDWMFIPKDKGLVSLVD